MEFRKGQKILLGNSFFNFSEVISLNHESDLARYQLTGLV